MPHFSELQDSVLPGLTPATAPDPLTQRQMLGAKIRQLRNAAGMSMSRLADDAGVSASLISQIERGLAEPSLATLRRIVFVLGVPITAVFVGEEPDAEGTINRHGQRLVVRRRHRKSLNAPGSAMVHQLMVPELGGNLEVVYTEIPPRSANPPQPAVHEGDETTIVTFGNLVAIHDDEEFELEWGDAISWDPSVPHWVENRTDLPAGVIGISTVAGTSSGAKGPTRSG